MVLYTRDRISAFFSLHSELANTQNGDFLSTARWIAIISFVICVFIVGLLSFKALDNPIAGFFSSILIAFSPLMVDTFSGFMSEPLFIGLLLVLVFIFFEFFYSEKAFLLFPIFIISSLLPIISMREYFLFLLSVFVFYIYRKYSRKAISRYSSLLTLISLTPIGIWFFNQYTNLNKVGGKRFFFDINQLKNIFQTILQEFQIIKGWMPYSGIYSNVIITMQC